MKGKGHSWREVVARKFLDLFDDSDVDYGLWDGYITLRDWTYEEGKHGDFFPPGSDIEMVELNSSLGGNAEEIE